MQTITPPQRRVIVRTLLASVIAFAIFSASCGGGGGTEAPAATFKSPLLNLLPLSLSFGGQAVAGPGSIQSVILTNSGNATVSVTSIIVAGTNASDFVQINDCGNAVAAGATCTINVTFTPTASGARTAVITLTDNATGSPHGVSVTGTGTAPAVNLSLTSLTFPSQVVGATSAPQSIMLSNTGNAALGISSITLAGTNPGDFAQNTTCGRSLAASANCSVSVTFTPTASGSRSASLSITDNVSGSPQAVSLRGNAPGGLTWSSDSESSSAGWGSRGRPN